MTEVEPTQDPRRPRPSRLPSPEIVGSGFAVVITVMILSAALAGPTPDPAVDTRASPTPRITFLPPPRTPTPPVDPRSVVLLRTVNEQLLRDSEILQSELRRRTFRVGEVAFVIRQINATVLYAEDVVANLGGALGEDEVGARMAAAYRTIAATAGETLGASLGKNPAAYEVGAGTLVKSIAELPILQEELEALLAAPPSPPVPSASPPQSVVPASPTPTVPPSATAAPTPTAGQTAPTGSPEPTPGAGEQVENGGFEAGVGEPWRLVVEGGGGATLAADEAAPFAGRVAARIEVTSPGVAFSAISLQQHGIELEAGRSYIVRLRLRSDAPREGRVRVVSSSGFSYQVADIMVGPEWAPYAFNFTASATTSSATFEVDLGRSDATTWIDSVSVRPS